MRFNIKTIYSPTAKLPSIDTYIKSAAYASSKYNFKTELSFNSHLHIILSLPLYLRHYQNTGMKIIFCFEKVFVKFLRHLLTLFVYHQCIIENIQFPLLENVKRLISFLFVFWYYLKQFHLNV